MKPINVNENSLHQIWILKVNNKKVPLNLIRDLNRTYCPEVLAENIEENYYTLLRYKNLDVKNDMLSTHKWQAK